MRRHHGQHAVFQLLQYVGFAVRLVDLGYQRLLIDGSVVVVDVEQLPGQRQAMNGVGLGFHAQVPVAGVVPAAAVEVRNVFADLVVSQGFRPLRVAVEVDVIHRRHARVVEMTGAMPQPVFFQHLHVAHLRGQEVFDGGLPDFAREHVGVDAEGLRLQIPVAHHVDAGVLHFTEVQPRVLVAQELPPLLGLAIEHLDHLPRLTDALEHDVGTRGVAHIQLDDGLLGLRGVVTHLRHLDHGRAHPALFRMRRHAPLDGVGGRIRRRQRAHDEPAIVVIAAAVEQLQFAALHGFDGQVIELGLGCDFELLAARQPGRLARPGRLLLEDAIGAAQLIRLAKQQARKQFEVEPHLPHPLLRDGRGEVHADNDGLALRPRAHDVVELEVRIDERVETLAIKFWVRKAKRHADLLRGRIHFAFAGFRNR